MFSRKDRFLYHEPNKIGFRSIFSKLCSGPWITENSLERLKSKQCSPRAHRPASSSLGWTGEVMGIDKGLTTI
jgi:hypothetical protein